MSAGLELAAGFNTEVVRQLVRVPHAAALLGEGSEVLGYDDAHSADHAWGPRLIIFVDHDEVALVVGRSMPDFPTPTAVIRSGSSPGRTTPCVTMSMWSPWLTGYAGQLSEARRALDWYSRDVWLRLMASQWRIIADQEPLPGRTSEAGDQRGTRLALTSLARSVMQVCFLQERHHWPYTK